jgi:hypothetical protein
VQDNFNIKDAVIMKRTPMMQNQAVEIITQLNDKDGNKLEKGLNELRINEGINLYVECMS